MSCAQRAFLTGGILVKCPMLYREPKTHAWYPGESADNEGNSVMSVLQLPEGDSADFSQGEVCFVGDATAALNGHLLDFSRSAHASLIAEFLRLLAGPGTPAASPPAPQALPDPLTESEIRILRYLPTHLTAREIADQLHVSAHTVTTHMRHLYAKLGAHRRHEAVAQARALGLLSPSSRRLRGEPGPVTGHDDGRGAAPADRRYLP